MGLFGIGKKKEEKVEKKSGELPELPRISELPELPKLKDFDSEPTLPPLPRYPPTILGDKFSQHTIREAVAGKKEEEVEADEFVKEQMMPKPLKIKPEFPSKIEKISPLRDLEVKTRSRKPVFIRIDKFEESLNIFKQTKEKISEMEKLLGEIKQLKEKEEKELSDWEAEIQTIKNQTEKVEKDIFSKIEG